MCTESNKARICSEYDITVDPVHMNVIHIVFRDKIIQTKFMQGVSDTVERIDGKTQLSYEGHNMPIDVFLQHCNTNRKFVADVRTFKSCIYMITYVRGDEHTKQHELWHSVYNTNKMYRDAVDAIYSALDQKSKRAIQSLFVLAGYNQSVHADEFQAYLMTDDRDFFRGKIYNAIVEHRSALLKVLR